MKDNGGGVREAAKEGVGEGEGGVVWGGREGNENGQDCRKFNVLDSVIAHPQLPQYRPRNKSRRTAAYCLYVRDNSGKTG